MCRFLILFAFTIQVLSAADVTHEEAKKNGMLETLRNYIENSAFIADVCVYEQEWIPPSKSFSKGQLVQWAVITHVHCGSWKVGQRIEYIHLIEDAPKVFGRFRSTVSGELRTFFYDPDELEVCEEGLLKISDDGYWTFRRVGDAFAELFSLELESNPKLKAKREHDGGIRTGNQTESK